MFRRIGIVSSVHDVCAVVAVDVGVLVLIVGVIGIVGDACVLVLLVCSCFCDLSAIGV